MSETKQHIYEAIDLKSFYASVESVARGLDPLTTNLVVADSNRTEKTICLAVSPSLKAYKIGGRARLFEVVQRVREINYERLQRIPDRRFKGKSSSAIELAEHPDWQLDYIVAMPRMAEYIRVSSLIYNIYLRFIAPEDIHVYSIDEVFLDVTDYLETYKKTPRELAVNIVRAILMETGITATAGIGTNMYLAKVAMDIVAKHVAADEYGVRIAELDEMSYRRQLWDHRPLTDFWRVGSGTARRLAQYGVTTMGQIARMSMTNEHLLYHLFGVNAELLIDHAWGWEPCTMEAVKAYRPAANSKCSGQVLQNAYTREKARIVIQEMADALSLELMDSRLVTDQIVITIGYDHESITNPLIRSKYSGPISIDHYGREVPKHAHGTINLKCHTSSLWLIRNAVTKLYDRIVNADLLIRRLYITACNVIHEEKAKTARHEPRQLDLFVDNDAVRDAEQEEKKTRAKERKMQEAMLSIKKKFGKNAILSGIDFAEGATMRERNQQIGGHKA